MLVECLVYCAVFAIIGGLAISTFYHARQANRDLRRCADDIVRAMQAGERWRADVRKATARPQLADWNGAAMLQVPQGDAEAGYVLHEGAVWRRDATNAAWQMFLPRVAASRMELDQHTVVASWRWEVELEARQTNARVRPVFTFQAVPAPEVKR